MAANTVPITPITPALSWDASAPLLTADTGVNVLTTYKTLLTAGANGTRLSRIRINPLGTNVATVMRFFVSNGSAPGTTGNNQLVTEVTLPATTVSQTAAQNPSDIVLPMVLKPGYKLLYTIGTAVASGFGVTVLDAGDY